MKKRIITGLIMLLVAIPVVYLGGYVFTTAVLLIALMSYKEMLDLKKNYGKIPNLMKILGAISMLFILYNDKGFGISYTSITYQRLIAALLLTILPVLFYKDNKYTAKQAFYLFGVVFFLGLGFNLFINARNASLPIFVFLISISTSNDIFALLGGLLFGKHKLMPAVSPKKTIEGSIVGGIFGMIIPLLVYHFYCGRPIDFRAIICTLVLCAASQIGDLVFSKFKRECEVKDFSNIFPGHGGMLDRLDSLFFVVMTFMLLIFNL